MTTTTTKQPESARTEPELNGPRAPAITPFRCPRRHADWYYRVGTDDYKCETCGLEFDELLDMREVGK